MVRHNSQEATKDFSCGQQDLAANTYTLQTRLVIRKRSVTKMRSDDEASHDEAPASKRQAVNNEPAVSTLAANHASEKSTEQKDSADPLLQDFQHPHCVGAINLPSAATLFGYDGSIQTQAMLGPIWECANGGVDKEDEEWYECNLMAVEYLNHVNDVAQQASEEWADVFGGWGDMWQACGGPCELDELVRDTCGQVISEGQGETGVGDEGVRCNPWGDFNCCFCQDEEK